MIFISIIRITIIASTVIWVDQNHTYIPEGVKKNYPNSYIA